MVQSRRRSSRRTARVDAKGRVSIPRSAREALGIKPGDILFFQQEGSVLRYAKAENPFDALAEQAVKEHRAGRTWNLREFARAENIPVDVE